MAPSRREFLGYLVGAAAASAVAAKVVWGATPPEAPVEQWVLHPDGPRLTQWMLPVDRHCYQSHWVAYVHLAGESMQSPKARYYYVTNEIPVAKLAYQSSWQALRLIDMVVENGWNTLVDELSKIGVRAGRRPEGWPPLQESGTYARRFVRL